MFMHIHVMKIIKKRKAKQRFILLIRVFTLLGILSYLYYSLLIYQNTYVLINIIYSMDIVLFLRNIWYIK